ncbi:hypothetical protein ACHAWF_016629 [Thalassiosira exigua]
MTLMSLLPLGAEFSSGWASTVIGYVTDPVRRLFSSVVAQGDSCKQQDLLPAPAVNPEENNFLIYVRLEGNDGVKHIRVIYSEVLGSYDKFIDALLDRYLPAEAKPFVASDYVVKLKEIVGDQQWSIDIENSKDILLANEFPFTKQKGHIKMSARIRLCTEPEAPITHDHTDNDRAETASDAPTVVSTSEPSMSGAGDAVSGDKRKSITPLKQDIAKPPAKRRKSSKKAIPAVAGGKKVSVYEMIIKSIAELTALGKPNPPRIQVAMFSGYSNPSSKGFANALSALKTDGMVAYPDNKSVALTRKGIESAEAKKITPPQSNIEVHDRMKALMKPKQEQIFNCLADGKPYLRDEIAARVGHTNPSSKGWANSVSKMSSIGILCYPRDDSDPKKKWVQLTDMCFPFGRPQQEAQGGADAVGSAHYRVSTPPPMGMDAGIVHASV